MNTQHSAVSKELTSQETAALLQRILAVVEKDERKRWAEIACALVLSLATMASAWCAYQSTLWSGVQTFRLAAAMQAGRDGTAASFAALQMRAFDAAMLINYLQAQTQNNRELEQILLDRFRPEMKTAVEAWLKTDPLKSQGAPSSPFKMAEYVQKELEEAKRHEDRSALEYAGARSANETSDTYVLLTVMFASVMFFGGIGGTFQSRRLRMTVMVIALTLFAVTLAFLGSMPVCKE